MLYDIAIPGAHNPYANRLHLFDVAEPAPMPWVGIDFDKGDIAHHLTSFLYPDDSDEAGRLLRVYQQLYVRYPRKPPEAGHVEADACRPDGERRFAGMREQFCFCNLEPLKVRHDLFFSVRYCLVKYLVQPVLRRHFQHNPSF